MKIIQIVYSGLGGVSSVAFSLVEGQSNKKYKNIFIFTGIEKIKQSYLSKCKKLKIKSFYIKKKKFEINHFKILNILKKNSPEVTIVHDYSVIPFKFYKYLKKNKIIYVHHTPDKTKRLIDWVSYFINAILADKVVLVSKRKKTDFINRINNYFFSKKVKIIENGINISKYKK